MSFKNIDPKQSFPKLEEEVLKFWQKKDIFKKTLKKDSPKGNFTFYEGPPTANGKPGIHHILARAFKDLIPRYKTMKGYHVERKAGWDTHGLPVELEVEKKLKISGKPEIEKYGIEKFNKKCKESVWFYKDEWEKMTERIGFWLDMDQPYITYESNYIESLWWIVKQIWDNGLLYQGHKVVPQCPRCGTALSSHEVAQGYKKISETSVYVKFKLADEKNTFVLAWTTTPWTLPGNVALALGKDINYIKVKQGEEFYVLAEDRVKILQGDYTIIEKLRAGDLEGKRYLPLFDFLDLSKKTHQEAYYLTLADFVTTEDGTGVVHTAVMYGEDDYNLGGKIGLPKYHTVDENGKFTDDVKPWAGRFVKDTDKDIIKYLKEKSILYKTETTTHDYPFCWRCQTPLIYYAKNSWFIKMSELRDKLLVNNKRINWVPKYIKDGRFGEWLREVKDWAISRERYWGTPLPIWECLNPSHKEPVRVCIGSVKELKQLSRDPSSVPDDLHRPMIDDVLLNCPHCHSEMQRVKEVMDCWFDSGAMPFAQLHYPFENANLIDKKESYPADYICEAIDQTRGWFYTLLAISTLLDKGNSYKNVICLGHILDKTGQKMSKSRGNVVDPWEVIDEFGADALRFHLYSMNQPGDPKRFDKNSLMDTLRKNLIILWNVYGFFVTYANVDRWQVKGERLKVKGETLLDKWILARLQELIMGVEKDLDDYDIFHASRQITEFISDLSTWYLRQSRKRRDGDFYQTMHQVLTNLMKILAPFIPYLSENIYQNLRRSGDPESVHLCKWPEINKKYKNTKLLEDMKYAREIVEKGHAQRKDKKIKVRQPLNKIVVYGAKFESKGLEEVIGKIILDELNIKNIFWSSDRKSGQLEVELDIKITPELAEEGSLRELTRQIQFLRKLGGFTADAKIHLYWQSDSRLIQNLFSKYNDQIRMTTICTQIDNLKSNSSKIQKDVRVNGEKVWLGVE